MLILSQELRERKGFFPIWNTSIAMGSSMVDIKADELNDGMTVRLTRC